MNAVQWKRGLATVALLSLLTVVVGCGSDESATGPDGSLSDASFLEVQPQVNTFIDSMFVAFSAGLSSYNEVPITDGQIRLFYGPGIPIGTNISTYEYTSAGWHHITLSVNNGANILGINDSIQFKSGVTAQESSTGADALDYRHHWLVTQVNQTADYTNFTGDIGYVFSALNTETTSISGSYGFSVTNHTVDTASISTNNSFTFTSATSGVGVAQPAGGSWASGCPSEGSVSFTIAQVKIVTNGSTVDTVNTSWTGVTGFNNGSATVSISDGTTTWGYGVSVCSPAL